MGFILLSYSGIAVLTWGFDVPVSSSPIHMLMSEKEHLTHLVDPLSFFFIFLHVHHLHKAQQVTGDPGNALTDGSRKGITVRGRERVNSHLSLGAKR